MRIFFTFLFCFTAVANAENIKSFTTDGCSVFPDGTFEQSELWLPCCLAHDYAYWQGGTYDDRRIADQALHQCVAETGSVGIANIMLVGVRLGGSPLLLTPFRWGYGWSYTRGYQALTEDEKKQIQSLKNDFL